MAGRDRLVDWVRAHRIVTLTPTPHMHSLVEKIVGSRIPGSWWSHPRGTEIFRSWRILADDPEVLALKLVNGKLSFIYADVWPLLLRVVEDSCWKQATLRTLDRASVALLEQVEEAGTLRLDLIARKWSGGAAALKKSRIALEKRGLVVSGDVHTEAGAHAQLLQSWQKIRDQIRARGNIKLCVHEALDELKKIAGGNRLSLEAAGAGVTDKRSTTGQ